MYYAAFMAAKHSKAIMRVSTAIEHKSAITDHANRNNCIIDWEGAKEIDRERNRNARWIKEAYGRGGYRLSHVWRIPDEGCR